VSAYMSEADGESEHVEKRKSFAHTKQHNRVIKWRKMGSHVVPKSVISIQRNVAILRLGPTNYPIGIL